MKAAILSFVVLAFSVNHAYAVSLAVKLACRDDYFAHCSMHAVGSPGVRKCMRAVGPRLSTQCISALAAAGEIGKKKMAVYKKKYAAKKHVAKKYEAKKYDVSERTVKKRYAKKPYAKKRYVKKRYEKKRYEKKQYARRDVARG
jgi:hypothetical protein